MLKVNKWCKDESHLFFKYINTDESLTNKSKKGADKGDEVIQLKLLRGYNAYERRISDFQECINHKPRVKLATPDYQTCNIKPNEHLKSLLEVLPVADKAEFEGHLNWLKHLQKIGLMIEDPQLSIIDYLNTNQRWKGNDWPFKVVHLDEESEQKYKMHKQALSKVKDDPPAIDLNWRCHDFFINRLMSMIQITVM